METNNSMNYTILLEKYNGLLEKYNNLLAAYRQLEQNSMMITEAPVKRANDPSENRRIRNYDNINGYVDYESEENNFNIFG